MSFNIRGGNMYKVMLVDDYEIFRIEIKRMNVWKNNLEFQIVAEASNGIEAIAFLEKNQIDVLITDIRMPQMDGMELLKIVSEKKLCPVVILLSDYTEYDYARQCLVHGAFDYIGKTPEERELSNVLERVEKFLEGYKRDIKSIVVSEKTLMNSYDIDKFLKKLISVNENPQKVFNDYYSFIIDTYGNDREKFIAIMKYIEEKLRKKITEDFSWIKLYYKEPTGNLAMRIEEGSDVVKHMAWRELGTVVDIIRRLMYTGDSELIFRICTFILENVDNRISAQSVCENIYISKAHLSEQFKKNVGMNLFEYMNMVKMERTKFLVEEGKMKNYEIAERLGFKDCEYFNKVFKKYTGMTMREYRNIK
jgi:Response regulator containing CheY-like receiver domain and AraC-type DNA-binding domain